MFKPLHHSLSDVFEIVVAYDEINSAVESVENIVPFCSPTKAEVSEMEYYVVRTHNPVPVADYHFIHLPDILKRTVAIMQYICVVEVGIGCEEQPLPVKLEVHCC